MYIIKNAIRCIARAKGRNILIGIIVLVIAVSSCLGLSIRQAAESAKKETLSSMSVTASISFDRSGAMQQMIQERGASGSDSSARGFDRDSFKSVMGEASALSLEEYLTYASAESVQNFYYSMTAYVNGGLDFTPVTTEGDAEEMPDSMPKQGGVMGGMKGGAFGANSDFTVVGYSGEDAMISFLNGTAAVTAGTIFEEGTGAYECIISEELAAFNELSVGDTVTIVNPNNEEEAYSFTVVGFYTDSSANENSFSRFGSTSTDPANWIYMSYTALQSIIDSSETEASSSCTSDNETDPIAGTLAATYVFADVESYEAFEEEVRELGLDDSYTVSSSDISTFEASMTPLNTLSTVAGYFLIVILIIGAVILVILNIFNVRERKYEIGVLTAMGMKKGKVAFQFLTEIFIVTLAAIVLGAGIGAVSSVPVTNALLESQIASRNSQAEQIEENFGRGGISGGKGSLPDVSENKELSAVDYINEIHSAMNFTVVLQMLGIGILLTLAAGIVSMLFVMRYDPLKILANRD